MIQFNLLPDVKLEYLKAERTRRLVISVSVLVTAGALVILLLLISVTSLQRKHLSDLNKDIKSLSNKISGQTDFNKILTIQNQLSSLTSLHAQKPAASRLTGFLSQVTPNQASINNLNVDFNQHQVTLTGTADSLATVNQYVDTLKYTKYAVKGSSDSKLAFSDVVLTTFGLTQHEADYTITLTYDQTIFDITQDVSSLTVPQLVTTRSDVAQPADLFKLPVDTPNAGATK